VVFLGVVAGVVGDINGGGENGGEANYSLAILPPERPASLAKTKATADPEITLSAAPTEAAPAPVGEPEPVVTPEPLPTMIVREGDTLNSLAEWFGVSAWDIAAVNGMSVDDYLQIGQVLAIPVASWQFVMPPETYVAVVEGPALEPQPEYVEPAVEPAAVAVAPPPPPPPPYTPPSGDAVIAAICSLPWPCEQMVRVAACESGLNPRAVNPAGYYGLFQISEMIAGWEDPLTNASYAYYNKYLPASLRGDGLSPWPACRYAYPLGQAVPGGSADGLAADDPGRVRGGVRAVPRR
jgi:resuscitation-promoting factor RpfB